MQDQDRADIIHQFLETALAMLDDTGTVPRWSDVAGMGRSLGMNDEEIDAVRDAARDYYDRGMMLSNGMQTDEAIEQLRAAAAIDPDSTTYLLALARAHLARWRLAHDPADREFAEMLAGRCRVVAPRFGLAAQLLHEIGGSAPKENVNRPKTADEAQVTALKLDGMARKRRMIRAMVVGWILLALGGTAAGWFASSRMSSHAAPSTFYSVELERSAQLRGYQIRSSDARERRGGVRVTAVISAKHYTSAYSSSSVPPGDTLGVTLSFLEDDGTVGLTYGMSVLRDRNDSTLYNIEAVTPIATGSHRLRIDIR